MSTVLRRKIKLLARRVLGLPTTKEYVMPRKHDMLDIAFRAVRSWRVEGDYLEFGVYRGRTFVEAYRQAKQTNRTGMRFYAFDSFEGLPQPHASEGTSKFYPGQFACSLEEFQGILEANNVDAKRVRCVKGFYAESLTPELQRSLAPMRAAIVWIDCDLYESARDVLTFVTPFVQTGTIICFDDWLSFGGHSAKGEIRAVNEWLDENPQIRLTVYRDWSVSGRSFVAQVS